MQPRNLPIGLPTELHSGYSSKKFLAAIQCFGNVCRQRVAGVNDADTANIFMNRISEYGSGINKIRKKILSIVF